MRLGPSTPSFPIVADRGQGSNGVVWAAFLANVGIAFAKFLAAGVTGS